jgi:hypothetical protein
MGPIQMPDVLTRGVAEARYDGTAEGRRARQGGAVVSGPDISRSHQGLVITSIRTADGAERHGNDFFVGATSSKPDVSLVN